MVEITLNNYINQTEKINLYSDGKVSTYYREMSEYSIIMDEWRKMTSSAREMPAFGVSLDKETKVALKKGLWIEFDFDNKIIYNDMPFKKLLVCVNAENTGFNLIRYNSEIGYSGRCFYFDLVDKNMANFALTLNKII